MKLITLFIASLLVFLPAAKSQQPRVTRPAMEAVEKNFNNALSNPGQADPFDLLGATRGVYLEGYGAVFSTQVSLVAAPLLFPFRTQLTKEQIDAVHAKKVKNLEVLKRAMRDMLVNAASSLTTLPQDEQIAVGVTLFYSSWEDKTGLPAQVLMQAKKSQLVLAKGANAQTLTASIRTQEF